MRNTDATQSQPPEETGEDLAEREELNIPRCQYGVPDETAYEDGYISDCGEPAIAKWSWKNGGQLFLCEKHDQIVEAAENEPVPEGNAVPSDSPKPKQNP
jgi:hypothetical protein